MDISAIAFEVQKSIFSKSSGIKRAQIIEMLARGNGFKTHAAYKSSSAISSEASYFLLVKSSDAMKSYLQSRGITNISDSQLSEVAKLLLTEHQDFCFEDEGHLLEHLTSEPSEMLDELEAELEEAASGVDGYYYEGSEVHDADYHVDVNGNLIFKVVLGATLQQIEGRMLSHNDYQFELVGTIMIPRITSIAFSHYQIIRTEITSKGNDYDSVEEGQ